MPLPPLRPRRSARRAARTVLLVAPAAAWLALTLLAANLVQLLALPLYAAARPAYRRLNSWLAGTWWGWCVTLAERLHGTRLVLSGEPIPRHENALLVANHQQMPDIVAVMMLAARHGRLGDLRWFVKEQLRWVPGIGWGMWLLGCVFVARRWTRDRRTVARAFATLLRERFPVWLVTFPEGTRITPAKLAASRAWAAERGRPELRHLLQPRTKGFTAAVTGLGGYLDAVYDLTIGYERGVPTLGQLAAGDVECIHLHVRRFPAGTLPSGREELASWLVERWREKDELLDGFYRTGAFPDRW